MQFYYKVDRKCTVWQREHYTVEAESQAEADAIAIDIAKQNDTEPDWIDDMADTQEQITPIENGGAPTVEVLRDTETIWQNAEYGNETEKEKEQE